MCKKSAHRIRMRVQIHVEKHIKILYSPLGCSIDAKVIPGKKQHQIL